MSIPDVTKQNKLKSATKYQVIQKFLTPVYVERNCLEQRFYPDLNLPCVGQMCQPIAEQFGYVVCFFLYKFLDQGQGACKGMWVD